VKELLNVKLRAMSALEKQAYSRLGRFSVCVAAAIFVCAWSVAYWQGWLFLAVFFGSTLAIIRYLAHHDPQLLERRMTAGPRAEPHKTQQVIQVLATLAFVALLLFPAIDWRFSWSAMPPVVSMLGALLMALGFLAISFVFRENSYASSIIEIGAHQKIVTSGPYSIVRHPMYSGALVMLLGMPLTLGSWWGLLLVIPITAVIVWRLLEEEKFLAANLPGYSAYQDKVRSRLLPFIW
jgi:protein-S-isoprenylcysteine O-methyltransferase Ste14